MPDSLHARAVELFSAGETADAIDVLRSAIGESFDLDALNDLAVMLQGAGENAAARELLIALRHIDPAHEGAGENLSALGPDAMSEARIRFLQVIADAQQVRLVDNLDHFFPPNGPPLPDPAQAGDRIAQQLSVLKRCGALWRGLGDDNSRELFLRY